MFIYILPCNSFQFFCFRKKKKLVSEIFNEEIVENCFTNYLPGGKRKIKVRVQFSVMIHICILFQFLCLFSEHIDPVADNHYELNEEPSPGDNAYDTVGPVGASGSKKKAPEKDSLPPVYAAVDKNNRQGNTVCKGLRRK